MAGVCRSHATQNSGAVLTGRAEEPCYFDRVLLGFFLPCTRCSMCPRALRTGCVLMQGHSWQSDSDTTPLLVRHHSGTGGPSHT
eukprot:5067466-Amphidinium_carterae.2